MPLDYNSLLIAIAFAAACLGITLFAAWLSARTEAFLLTWAIGALLLVGSVLIYSAYVMAPAPYLVVLAFLVHIAGFATLYGAARQFRTGERPLRAILTVGVPLLVVALPGFATRFDAIGFILTNLVVAALLFLTAREYWVGRQEAPGPIMGLTGLYALAGVSFVLCAAVIIADGQLELGRAPENWAENLNLVIGIAAVAGVGAISLALNQSRLARTHRREARTDGLTGLLNRRAVFDLFSERDLPPFTSVVVFDLDGFKAVNDGHGHAIGDEVLRRFALAIRQGSRGVDTAARLGGEEFALVLPRSSPESALQVAERIRGALPKRPTKPAERRSAAPSAPASRPPSKTGSPSRTCSAMPMPPSMPPSATGGTGLSPSRCGSSADCAGRANRLVIRFRHLHPVSPCVPANVGIKGSLGNSMSLVELLNLTFDCEFGAGGFQMSNSLH